jgi:hypothetical protein
MDTIRHRIRYRAKNALGGYVVENATAEATLDTSHVELEVE